jgi:GT2 family glycosyltransferase
MSQHETSRALDILSSVSVIIPTYNRSSLLIETLERCRRYSEGMDIEFVVIDDGSKDETATALEALATTWPDLNWRSVENTGPGQARNLGASLATKDVLLFMGDDIQPQDEDFFRVHAQLHAQSPTENLGVLGKIVWPSQTTGGKGANFVMSHVQGVGGEQFGYSDLAPYSFVDWRFFYTANISVRRNLVRDWLTEGFSDSFPLAAWEDAEFAYRMSERKENRLRIFYTPASTGTHHHQFSVDSFMQRQNASGLMAGIFCDLHPQKKIRTLVGTELVHDALSLTRHPDHDKRVPDLLSLIEGIKSWARLSEARFQLGTEHWHEDMLRAVFRLSFLEGFIMHTSDPEANLAAAYQRILDDFVWHMSRTIHVEFSSQMLTPHNLLSPWPMGTTQPSSLRLWAAQRPFLRTPFLRLRRLMFGR